MIYGYETPVDMPVPELYDTGLMRDYINSAKTMYEKGEKQLDDFYSKYGDFTSPFEKDVQEYDNLTRNRMNKVYDDLMAQGIDPLRTPEGRAALTRAIRETPVGYLAQLKQGAETGKEYLKNLAKLRAEGQYDENLERFLMGGINFKDWSTRENGMFNRMSPTRYQDLHSITDDWFKHVDPKYNEKLTKERNDGYRYLTVDENDIQGVLNSHMDDFLSTDLGRYNFYLEKEAAKKANPYLPDSEINKIATANLREDMVNRNSDYLREKYETDEWALARQKHQWDLDTQRRQFAHDRAKSSKTSNDATNYHQSQLNLAAFMLSGGNATAYAHYVATGDMKSIIQAGSNASTKQYSTLRSINQKNSGGFWGAVNKSLNRLSITSEPIGLIASRYDEKIVNVNIKGGGFAKGIVMNDALLSKSEGAPNWVSRSAGSVLKYGAGKSERTVYNEQKAKGKTLIFVPAYNNNVKAHVTNKGSIETATSGYVYSADIDSNGNINNAQKVAHVMLPITHSDVLPNTVKNGKVQIPSKNTTSISATMQGEVADMESGVSKSRLGLKNDDSYVTPQIW